MVQETGALNSVPGAVSCLPPMREVCDFKCACVCVCPMGKKVCMSGIRVRCAADDSN